MALVFLGVVSPASSASTASASAAGGQIVAYRSGDEMRASGTRTSGIVILPAGIQTALDRNLSPYRFPRREEAQRWRARGEFPFVAFADFDDDGLQDAAGIVISDDNPFRALLVAFTPIRTAKYGMVYVPHTLNLPKDFGDRTSYAIAVGVERVPGIPTPCISVFHIEGNGTSFCWIRNQFREVDPSY